MVPHETGKARSGALQIHFRRVSAASPGGTPLVIVHGLSFHSEDWLPAAQALAAGRDVACMDMRGFGASDWSPERDYSVKAMAGDIGALLDHLGWRRTVLVGHSMGGRSTTCYAAQHPERIAGLALIDFSPENAQAGSRRVANNVANNPDRFRRDPHFREQFKRLLETGERPKLDVDMWQLIREIRCPILSMRGARSDLYAPETKAKMQAANPRLELVEVDAGHNVAGDNLPGFVSALNHFLKEHSL
jgi:pimeloyl-ACP methyl ester carboxylesterase